MKPLLFVALDDLSKREREVFRTIEELAFVTDACDDFGFKMNLDYLLNEELGLRDTIGSIRETMGRPVFADLKMWNGERTMARVVQSLVDLEVDYLNVYALADSELPKVVKITEGTKTKVLAVTVLTHYDDAYCQRHFGRGLKATVLHFTEVAMERGCHGVIVPGTALDVVRDLDIIKAVPGVRPSWYKDTRHQQEITPLEAVQKGADILVCGSPIMRSQNPAEALQKVLAEILSA